MKYGPSAKAIGDCGLGHTTNIGMNQGYIVRRLGIYWGS